MTELHPAVKKHIEGRQEKQDGQEVKKRLMGDLYANMREISADGSGSELRDYLSEEEAVVCEQFVDFANQAGWPKATTISMQAAVIPKYNFKDRKIEKFPAWKSPMHTAKSGLTQALFFPYKGSIRKGYVFAKLGIPSSQIVALCDDGKLRSERGPELHRSMGIGWGRLPDPALLTAAEEVEGKRVAALSAGHPAIYYGNPQLADVLFSKIPGKHFNTPTTTT